MHFNKQISKTLNLYLMLLVFQKLWIPVRQKCRLFIFRWCNLNVFWKGLRWPRMQNPITRKIEIPSNINTDERVLCFCEENRTFPPHLSMFVWVMNKPSPNFCHSWETDRYQNKEWNWLLGAEGKRKYQSEGFIFDEIETVTSLRCAVKHS